MVGYGSEVEMTKLIFGMIFIALYIVVEIIISKDDGIAKIEFYDDLKRGD